jgi:hypothetical protein
MLIFSWRLKVLSGQVRVLEKREETREGNKKSRQQLPQTWFFDSSFLRHSAG